MFARALIIVGVSQRESLSARAVPPCVSRLSDNPRQTEIIAFFKFLLMRLFCIFPTFQHNAELSRTINREAIMGSATVTCYHLNELNNMISSTYVTGPEIQSLNPY